MVDGTDSPVDSALDDRRVERRVHEVANRVRRTRGVTAVAYDPDLQPIVRYHSERMAAEGDIFHEAPDGETLRDRTERFGYDPVAKATGQAFCHACGTDLRAFARPHYCPFCGTGLSRDRRRRGVLGENVAYHRYGRDSIAGTDEGRVATSVVNGWLDSPDHRANLLDERFDRHAVGVTVTAVDGAVHVYVTQQLS
jgi:uncharacterized protein YkwD